MNYINPTYTSVAALILVTSGHFLTETPVKQPLTILTAWSMVSRRLPTARSRDSGVSGSLVRHETLSKSAVQSGSKAVLAVTLPKRPGPNKPQSRLTSRRRELRLLLGR